MQLAGKLVCSALTSNYHHCIVCFVLNTVTLTYPLGWNCSLLRWAENSNVIGKKLPEMLKFPARESCCFTLIIFALTRQETVKNNNKEQFPLFSNSGRFSWYVGFWNISVSSRGQPPFLSDDVKISSKHGSLVSVFANKRDLKIIIFISAFFNRIND